LKAWSSTVLEVKARYPKVKIVVLGMEMQAIKNF
jgi:hypothetical protein